MRVKRGIVRHRRHKKIRTLAKGYMGQAGTTYVKAKEAVMKAGQHAFRDRRRKKRDFRSLWIIRLNAAVRSEGMTYAGFMQALKKKKVGLNRKSLSELAVREPAAFAAILKHVRS
ncbi:MAG: 50S ribosomal subunit protein L20 [Candidatus Peregrinibacteria bacterium Gr01-1014_25]|nr:MAG: 50S ribosomal subunit protein L20 [Candidatus Peregrinibacteria bacterium Gr01-1014_25]